MSLTLVRPPAAEPLSLSEARAWLRLDGTGEDDLVTRLVTAARLAVEAASRRKLIAQAWTWRLDAWPQATVLACPLSPLLSLGAVTVATASGAVTVPPAMLALDTASDPPRLALLAPPPAPDPPIGGIAVALVAGYGATAFDVPETLRQAVRLTLAALFENRGDERDDRPGAEAVPPSALALVAAHRRARL